MSDLNLVILRGRLGSPPQPREAAEGAASMCSFVLATGERWTDKNGNPQSRTVWHKIITWGRVADWAKGRLKKGTQIFLIGKITQRTWQGSTGEEKSAMEIQAERIEMQ